jgi:hypothetical protein
MRRHFTKYKLRYHTLASTLAGFLIFSAMFVDRAEAKGKKQSTVPRATTQSTVSTESGSSTEATTTGSTPSTTSTGTNGLQEGEAGKNNSQEAETTPKLDWLSIGIGTAINTLPSLIFFTILWKKIDSYQQAMSTKFDDFDRKVSTLQGGMKEGLNLKPLEQSLKAQLKILENAIMDLPRSLPTQSYTNTEVAKTFKPEILTSEALTSDLHPLLQRYNEIIDQYDNNPDRKSALEKEYGNQLILVSVNNPNDVDGDVPPELKQKEVEKATFYCYFNDTSYLVLPIPGQASVNSKYFKAIYAVAGSGSSVASIEKPAQFKQQGNVWQLESKGNMTVG